MRIAKRLGAPVSGSRRAAANAWANAYTLRSATTWRRPIPFGKYELLERINVGGMAEILKARDLSDPGRPIVAVKRILPHLAEDRQFAAMFLDESRVLAQLEHPNIIRTLEVGKVGDTPFIALEYVFGQDARTFFHRARQRDRPIPVPVACFVLARVCGALHHAHEQTDARGELLGLVHRDVSLQNILVSYEGEVKLSDFGIAMSAENRARTEAGIVKGKFGYMSPEQVRGEPLDRRSDVFAAGICLYELITGERLFSGDSDYAAIEKVRHAAVESPSRRNREVSSALEAITMKALARHPRDRYQTARDLEHALVAESGERACTAADLAAYMRDLFAEERRQCPTPEMLRRGSISLADESTGLSAFDHLDPVSTVSEASAVQFSSLPSHAPLAPVQQEASASFERAPGSMSAASEPGPRGTSDQAPASERGRRRVPLELLETLAAEPDSRRQLGLGETLSGIGGVNASGIRPLTRARGAPSPFEGIAPGRGLESSVFADFPPGSTTFGPRTRDEPTLRVGPRASYTVVVGIVTGIVALIATLLWLTSGTRTASVHLSTEPSDAEVFVDGRRLDGAQTPLVIISDLSPGVPHAIEVRRPGYRTWSAHLTLTSGQVLRLPPVRLVRDPAEQAARPEPATPGTERGRGRAPPVEGARARGGSGAQQSK